MSKRYVSVCGGGRAHSASEPLMVWEHHIGIPDREPSLLGPPHMLLPARGRGAVGGGRNVTTCPAVHVE